MQKPPEYENVLASEFLFTTSRLKLRPLELDDVDRYHAMLTDAGVRRFLLDDIVVPREWVLEEIGRSRVLFQTLRCGTWLVGERQSGEMIGFCGFRHFFEPAELQLFYGLLPAYWGRGYATEACGAVIGWAFDALGFDTIVAATDPPNTASIRLLERLGMRSLGEKRHEGVAALYFQMSRHGVSATE